MCDFNRQSSFAADWKHKRQSEYHSEILFWYSYQLVNVKIGRKQRKFHTGDFDNFLVENPHFLCYSSTFNHDLTINMIARKRRILWYINRENADSRPKSGRSRHSVFLNDRMVVMILNDCNAVRRGMVFTWIYRLIWCWTPGRRFWLLGSQRTIGDSPLFFNCASPWRKNYENNKMIIILSE